MSTPSNHAFVPLELGPATKGKSADFRVLVSDRPQAARPLRELHRSPANSDPNHTPLPGCEPRVTLHKEADRIIGIHIECSCGQITELKCGYEA